MGAFGEAAARLGESLRSLAGDAGLEAALIDGQLAKLRECVLDVGERHYRCRACGAFMRRDGLLDACGPMEPRFCPNCGRMIVWKGIDDVDGKGGA